MRSCIASLALYLMFGLCAALAQALDATPPEVPLALEEQGPALGKDSAGSVSFSEERLREGGINILLRGSRGSRRNRWSR